MTRLTTTTLILALAAPTAFAASHTGGGADAEMSDTSMDTQVTQPREDRLVGVGGSETSMTGELGGLVRTRDIVGSPIYTVDPADDEMSWDDDTAFDTVSDSWNRIGEIEDIVLSENGSFAGIVAEIGGVLDIADKHVYLEMSDVRLVPANAGGYVYVTENSEERLEEMDSVDESYWN